ncbi:PREDICTED: uncharacterized protein At2g29880-like [Ipomoea nil]|uniref:uncharacterized protein At2g29880-like n=1 Tax=Ipomoea nil TaxID=35883 RepID=UPI000901AACE|nr:PREDICTED: uncharacterized protein At2g29880-like [Ipomoea nil]
MEGFQQGNSMEKNKVVGNYTLWTREESNELLRLMVNAVKNGWCGSSGGLSKTTIERKILPLLNEKFGCQRSYAHYQSRLKWFKRRFYKFSELMHHNSEFRWDPTTKRFMASDEVWKDYFKCYSTHKNLRTYTIADYEDLAIIFGNTNTTGNDTDARIYNLKEDKQHNIDELQFDSISINDEFTLNDAYVASQDPQHLQYTSSIPQEINEATSTKYFRKKRNRIESCDENSLVEDRSNILEKLSICLDSIAADLHSLVQKRENGNNCWNAIKELPGLDNDTRFKAIEWLNTETKKHTFLDMSSQDRYNWIMFKLSK